MFVFRFQQECRLPKNRGGDRFAATHRTDARKPATNIAMVPAYDLSGL
jgi:hypothetical protein